MEGCGGRQEQGMEANTSTGLAAGPDGLLLTGLVLWTAVWGGRGAEQPSSLPEDNEEKQTLGGCLLGLLLAADPMPRLPGQEMSETPRRIVQGLERKPLTLATIRKSEGGGRGKSLFA